MSHDTDPAKHILLPQTVESLIDYLNTNFAHMGLEVLASGQRSVTVEVPIVVHDLSAIAIGVDLEFGARIDARLSSVPKSGMYFTITLPHDPPAEITESISGSGTAKRRRHRFSPDPVPDPSSGSDASNVPDTIPTASKRTQRCHDCGWHLLKVVLALGIGFIFKSISTDY